MGNYRVYYDYGQEIERVKITSALLVDGTVQFNIGSDNTGDIFYRGSNGLLTKLAIGSSGEVLQVSNGLPAWGPGGGGGGGSVTADNGLNMSSATNVQLGGPLGKNTDITTSSYLLHIQTSTSGAQPFKVTSIDNAAIWGTSTAAAGVYGSSQSGAAGSFQSVSGFGLMGGSETNYGADIWRQPATTNDVVGLMRLRRVTGSASDGIGSSIDFQITHSGGATVESGKIINKWTTALSTSRTSQLEFWAVNNTNSERKLVISGNGQLIFDDYGTGTFEAAPTYIIGVASDGTVIEIDPADIGGGGASITADNGLTMSTATNVQLGGSLLGNTYIATGAYNLTISTTNSGVTPLNLTATTGAALNASNTSGAAVLAYSSGGPGIQATSDGGSYAGIFRSYSPANSNVLPTLKLLSINGSGPTADGFGSSIDFELMTTNFGTSHVAASIITKWTTAENTNRTSQIEFHNTLTGNLARRMAIAGSGQITLDNYGDGTFEATPVYVLGVTSAGVVVEVDPADLGGGGGTSYTFSNGITEATGAVTLGGNLTAHTTIDGGANYSMIFQSAIPSGASLNTMKVINSGLFGTAIRVEATNAGTAIDAYSNSGYAVNVTSGSGPALQASSTTNTAIIGIINPSSTNSTATIVNFIRNTSGTAANGIGIGIDLTVSTDGGAATANQLVSKWTNAVYTSRVSQFEIWGVNNTTTARKLAIAGSGMLTLDGYTSAVTSGAVVYALAVDASGNVVTTSPSGGSSYTFSNGINESGGAVKLGGALTGTTTITTTGQTFSIVRTGSGTTLAVTGQTGTVLTVDGTSGVGLHVSVTGANAAIKSAKHTTSTNDIQGISDIVRTTSGTAAVGLGAALDYYLQNSAGATLNALRISTKWANATSGSTQSTMEIQLQDSGTLNTKMSLFSNGKMQLNLYGSGTHTGTAAYRLEVDSSGNIIEVRSDTIKTYTPSGSTDNTYTNGTITADDTYLYFRKSDGTWVKMAWQTF